MRSSKSQWMLRQLRRCRRFFLLLPHLCHSTFGLFYELHELCGIFFFHGFTGLKSFCRTIEAQRKLDIRPAVKIDPGKRGYVIVAPNYASNSAGVGCLYRLCDELNRRGFPSRIAGSNLTTRDLMAPLVSWDKAKQLCSRGYAAVYHEAVVGNPLRARTVARWVLNRPGLLGGEEVYDQSEHVFYYCNAFLPYIRNRVVGKLFMPTIDESLFFCDDGDPSKRSLECFYVGKSQWKDGIIDRSRVFEITRETPPKKELGKLFRASRVLYCFDNSTILAYEAILCGCPVVIIPDGTQTRADYESLELGMDGMAWGLEELDRVRLDVQGLRRRYEQVKRDYIAQLERFIEITQSQASSISTAAEWPKCAA
ncbi:MAG: hypothetical protein ABSA16_03780 [Thermoguttaceae bacterium]